MIQADGSTKLFGHKRAVDGISFSAARGEILGFLGPNGAGKSTTMRMLTGFLPPSAGRVTIGGFDMVDQPIPAKRLIGLAVSLLDARQTVALSPDRQRLLKYDISRAISQVMNPVKPVVGVMSALPVFGQPANPMMQEEGQQGTPPWEFINELGGDYTLR